MDIGAARRAHGEAVEAVAPGEGAFDDPALPAEPFARFDATSRDARGNAAAPTGDVTTRIVVGFVSMELVRTALWLPTTPPWLVERWNGVEFLFGGSLPHGWPRSQWPAA